MKNKAINFTDRDYNSIKNFLLEYTKQYYPNTFRDFTESSFGAMVIDLLSIIGDNLSFYIDFQGNELILDTAKLYENIIKLAKERGYKDTGKPSSFSEQSFYVIIPIDENGQPDDDYVPILKKDSSFSVESTNSSFILLNDVDFTDAEKIVASIDDNGIPSSYAFKAKGNLISGARYVQSEDITDFENYLRIKIRNPFMSEILSVTDSNGNEYYQVDYLQQNVVYKLIKNTNRNYTDVPYVLSKLYAPRRFVIETDGLHYYLVFGNGSVDSVTDPRNIVLNFDSRKYITEKKIDPKNIIESDKFGIAPINTTLSIVYRANNTENNGASVGKLNKINSPLFKFKDEALNKRKINQVISSLETENEDPVTYVDQEVSAEEIKIRAYGMYSAQDRAVTKEDYIHLCYAMDPRLGSIKRANIYQDTNSFKRNLNLFVIGEDEQGNLVQCSNLLKENLKSWFLPKKMINDTIDILDANIINLYIEFTVDSNYPDKSFVLQKCINKIRTLFNEKLDIGESFPIYKIYKTLNVIPEVIDTKNIKIRTRDGGLYASTNFDINYNISPDKEFIFCPNDSIFEIKYFDRDIIGTVI
jgi:hypothetical protein